MDLRDRAATYRQLREQRYDVLVIGGGIMGAGIARDAAMRGLSVALVEARDLASGTSSTSSKILHGGLHYLLAGDLATVRKTVNERQILRKIAPHLARPLEFVIPRRSRPALAALDAALHAYEWLGAVPETERRRIWMPSELTAEEPLVDVGGVPRVAGAVVYPELRTNDARLVVANARAAFAAGAVVATWAPVERVDAGEVLVRDALAQRHEALVRARLVVNAAGPWVASVGGAAGHALRRVRLRKGIHLVLPSARVPIRRAIVMNDPSGRVTFAVPSGGFVYLGTTDTPHDEPEHAPEVTSSDVAYLLSCARATFPAAELGARDVVAAWAGLRVLGASGESRANRIDFHGTDMLSVVGGKLTGYRAIACQVVDICAKRLGMGERACTTANVSLPGAQAGTLPRVAARLSERGLTSATAERLLSLYGEEAEDVADSSHLVDGEIDAAVRREGALRLEDWWFRRSARAAFDVEGDASLLRGSLRMAQALGWTEREREAEVASCLATSRRAVGALARLD
jgi:glycerol-3-phosphate dehydrogenase